MIVNGLGSGQTTDRTTKTTGKGQNSLDQTDFMNLLLEQIKNQDPMSPMENTEFISQLSQFNMLSGITDVNKTLNSMMLSQISQNNASLVNLIGKRIEILGNEVVLNQDNRDTELTYELTDNAQFGVINIFDKNGNKVDTIENIPKNEGVHTVSWDNERIADGVYTFKVDAKDISGKVIPAIETMKGEVTDITFEGNQTFIHTKDKKVTIGEITRISSN